MDRTPSKLMTVADFPVLAVSNQIMATFELSMTNYLVSPAGSCHSQQTTQHIPFTHNTPFHPFGQHQCGDEGEESGRGGHVTGQA